MAVVAEFKDLVEIVSASPDWRLEETGKGKDQYQAYAPDGETIIRFGRTKDARGLRNAVSRFRRAGIDVDYKTPRKPGRTVKDKTSEPVKPAATLDGAAGLTSIRDNEDTRAWRLTRHGRKRATERDLSIAEIRHAATYPDTAYPSGTHAGREVRYAGRVLVVVDESTKAILTVYANTHAEEQEVRDQALKDVGDPPPEPVAIGTNVPVKYIPRDEPLEELSEDEVAAEVRTWAGSQPTRFLECRIYGHNFKPRGARWDNVDYCYETTLRCPRCTTERIQFVSATGAVLGGGYDYDPKYRTPAGMGRITGISRDALRLETLTRHLHLGE